MPHARTIVEGLRVISNDAIGLAIGWHVVMLVVGAALWMGWRASRRTTGLLLTAPIASAAATAFAFSNPFNGAVLGILAIALVVVALRLDERLPPERNAVTTVAGVVVLAFGFFYPHFLETRPAAIYLVAAPIGLVPCPTLALVIGITVIAGGLGSRAWSLVLAVAGLFYGVFGVFRLGVQLDIGLVAGAIALLAVALSTSRKARAPRHLAQPSQLHRA